MALGLRSGNPALNDKAFRSFGTVYEDSAMTVQGTMIKSIFLLALVVLTASITWNLRGPLQLPLMIAGGFGSIVPGLIMIFKKNWAPVLAPLYALMEGLFLGGISLLMEQQFAGSRFGQQLAQQGIHGGLVITAVAATFGTAFAVFLAYSSGMIKPTEKFKVGIFAAIAGVGMIYFVSFILSLAGHSMGFINGSSPLGIGFSLIVTAIAALSLILDFDLIQQGASQGAPKYMEWYGAYALMVTLIWLYIEFLRLLSKLSRR